MFNTKLRNLEKIWKNKESNLWRILAEKICEFNNSFNLDQRDFV